MKFNKVFNTTWTYHRKSDIRTTYSKGYFQRKSSSGLERKQEEINYVKGKTKMAAWFSSNCEGVSSKRYDMVDYSLIQFNSPHPQERIFVFVSDRKL